MVALGTAAEVLVRQYYELVDAGNTEALLQLFTNDVHYQRQGTPDLVGIDAMRHFYEHDRLIDYGRHVLDEVLVGQEWVAVRGTFRGWLRSGEAVTLEFTDWHHVVGGRIDRRQSFFPGRRV